MEIPCITCLNKNEFKYWEKYYDVEFDRNFYQCPVCDDAHTIEEIEDFFDCRITWIKKTYKDSRIDFSYIKR